MSLTDELPETIAAHAWVFTYGALPMPPARRVAVLACMNAGLNAYGILGLEAQEAGVIRTAGGVVSDDAIGSLLAARRLLGTGEIVLIHHTDCGMLTFGDYEVRAAVRGGDGSHVAVRAGGVRRPDRGVRQSVARIRRARWCRTSTPSAVSSARLP